MKKYVLILLAVLFFNLTQVVIAQHYEFRNGYWFDGKKFNKRTFYSTGGVFTSRKPDTVDSVIDLAGKYVVPPFGEAHNHNLGGASGLERQIEMYLREGVFYSKNLHYVRDLTAPALLRLIVKKAHNVGLRVSSHIETAADFRNALLAGVDEIAHLPGYRIAPGEDLSKYQISDEAARLVAKKGVIVVTTTVLSNNLYRNDANHLKVIQDNHARNLQLLAKHRVKIALGSDTINATSVAEAMNLHTLKAFDNLTLLKLWCENTPQAIFPGRRIAYLRDGYEASFLALEGNPLDDFMNVKRIGMRFKQGVFINIAQNKQ